MNRDWLLIIPMIATILMAVVIALYQLLLR
jgi:hypothetical protein